jgi:uncharacterized membrane protein (UPF0127 family)
MSVVRVQNLDRPSETSILANFCESFGCQLRGLMFRRVLPLGEGILLVQRSDSYVNAAIHMLGMGFDICAVWINSEYEVVDVKLARRWRLAYIPRRPARYILEIHPAHLAEFAIGDHVEITPA